MNRDEILLTIPGKPEYISTIRLTTSSIASKMGLDIDSIEDLRVAISEACNIVMGKQNIKIEYTIEESGLSIKVSSEDRIDYKNDQSMELGKQILNTLVDEVEFTDDYIMIKKYIGDRQ
ncbi:MAG: anti-sigma regulatory factor [Tissierellia bacterium]|nr:anti-sigma regulatory factor [Tissierellia bacterium]